MSIVIIDVGVRVMAMRTVALRAVALRAVAMRVMMATELFCRVRHFEVG